VIDAHPHAVHGPCVTIGSDGHCVHPTGELDLGFRAPLAGTRQWRERGGTLVLAGAHGLVRRGIEVIGGTDRGGHPQVDRR
jgi:hypothetical protein